MFLPRGGKRALLMLNDQLYERDRFRQDLSAFELVADPVDDAKSASVAVVEIGGSSVSSTDSNYVYEETADHRVSVSGDARVAPLAPEQLGGFPHMGTGPDSLVRTVSPTVFERCVHWHMLHPLTDVETMFPWLHGLHTKNTAQIQFFTNLYDQARPFDPLAVPRARGFMAVYSEGRVPTFALKNLVAPLEILKRVNVSREELRDIVVDTVARMDRVYGLFEREAEREAYAEVLYADCQRIRTKPSFRMMDPVLGITLRNFHIQTHKVLLVLDMAVYCFEEGHGVGGSCACASVARVLNMAQMQFQSAHPCLRAEADWVTPKVYNTVVVEETRRLMERAGDEETRAVFQRVGDEEEFETWDTGYGVKEKAEIGRMSRPTHVTGGVWMGNAGGVGPVEVSTADASTPVETTPTNTGPASSEPPSLSVDTALAFPYCNPSFLLVSPSPAALPPLPDFPLQVHCHEHGTFPTTTDITTATVLDFPLSGLFGVNDLTSANLAGIVNAVRFLLHRASPAHPCLVHSSDGYTENLLLIFAFLMAKHQWLYTHTFFQMHTEYGRPFFLFPSDQEVLRRIESVLHAATAAPTTLDPHDLVSLLKDRAIGYPISRTLLPAVRGPFPNDATMPLRILPHLYLGSLEHALNLKLLREMGITRVITIGEQLPWLKHNHNHDGVAPRLVVASVSQTQLAHARVVHLEDWHLLDKVLLIENIQDDGIDQLTDILADALQFIDQHGFQPNKKVLVHCRVGVLRSATVVIAEVMRRLSVNLARAYMYVRVRRLNVIIQPNLRFFYELFKWEEAGRQRALGTLLLLASMMSTLACETKISENNVAKHQRVGCATGKAAWLRDVDWFVLCREITGLNEAYMH